VISLKNIRLSRRINSLFAEPADWKLIAGSLDEMLRVAVSIRAGKPLPSAILRRLGSYSRHNRLRQAFRELGRVVRTDFLLNYINDLELRRRGIAPSQPVSVRTCEPIRGL